MISDSYINDLFTDIEEIIAIRDRPAIERLKKGLRQSLRIVDKASQAEYATHRYRFGSSRKQRKRRGGSFRGFASKASSYRYRFNVEKGRRPWRFQSMMKRKGRNNDYQGNLSHLLEDGSWNNWTGRKNKAYKVRYAAFQRVQEEAKQRAVKAFRDAILGNS